MAERWIKLYEKLDRSSIYHDSEMVHLWVHLLIKATKFPYKVNWGGEEMILKPGELITGRKKLSSDLKVNESKIQRSLKFFEKYQMIEQRTNRQSRIISILNWDQYQSNEQRSNNDRTTSEQRVNTNKKERKKKEENTTNAFELFWTAYPKKKSKGQAEKAFNRINPSKDLLSKMIQSISDQKCSEDWIKNNGQFIPYPATWLNAKGWEDESPQQANPMSV